MTFIETVIQRNSEFANHGHSAELKIIPSTKTIIVGCLDPRVDPMDVLGLKPGEAAIYRNIGGRINPALVESMILLPIVTRAAGQEMGSGWNLIVLHHTECGIIGCYKHAPDLLASHLGVSRSELDSMAITDPRRKTITTSLYFRFRLTERVSCFSHLARRTSGRAGCFLIPLEMKLRNKYYRSSLQ